MKDLSLELQTACPLACGKVTWRSLKPPSHLVLLPPTEGSGDERWRVVKVLGPQAPAILKTIHIPLVIDYISTF